MSVRYEIRQNTYFDSVTLMLISKDVGKIEGVREVIVGMGTELNKEIAENLGVMTDELRNMGPNDFFVACDIENDGIFEDVVAKMNELLTKKSESSGDDYKPRTMDTAILQDPDLNLALISVAGKYAALEAERALERGLHVMMFSDNVSVADERRLKELASSKGLLMMGPDCGTAIINNVPLAFANVISKGDIGIVGASGTGTQEVSVIIDKLGAGVSQVIGTGGRDLKSEIGGIMMMDGFKALMADPDTKIIVLISKPPAEDIMLKILQMVKDSPKPVVVDFIGGDYDLIKSYGAYPALTLEDAARKAVMLSNGEEPYDFGGFDLDDELIDELVKKEQYGFTAEQKYVRGMFTGGTLTDEGMKLLTPHLGGIHSNIPLDPEMKLSNPRKSVAHTFIDFGDDEFTQGRPHPMIDPFSRVERIYEEANDEETAVMVMDFVLGYGSNADPVGEMLESIVHAKKAFADRGQYLSVVASICGTDKDPQSLDESRKRLEDVGVVVMPSNAQAARFVLKLVSGR